MPVLSSVGWPVITISCLSSCLGIKILLVKLLSKHFNLRISIKILILKWMCLFKISFAKFLRSFLAKISHQSESCLFLALIPCKSGSCLLTTPHGNELRMHPYLTVAAARQCVQLGPIISNPLSQHFHYWHRRPVTFPVLIGFRTESCRISHAQDKSINPLRNKVRFGVLWLRTISRKL